MPKLLFLLISSTTHIPYQCAIFGDDRALFNVITFNM